MTLNSSTQLCNKNLKTNLQIRPIWYNSRRAAIIPRLLRSDRREHSSAQKYASGRSHARPRRGRCAKSRGHARRARQGKDKTTAAGGFVFDLDDRANARD